MMLAALNTALHPIDWIIVVAYFAAVIGLGIYLSRSQHSVEDYFLAGGNLGSFVVGISVYATLLSVISYLSIPGEMIGRGPVYLWSILSIPIFYVIAGYLIIPALMRKRVTSVYELLEMRFSRHVRVLGSCLFLIMRIVWMGLMIDVTANALVIMLQLSPESAPWIVVTIGAVAIAYTAMGGLRAVIITDVFQFFLLLLGAILTIVLISVRMDGLSWWPTTWAPHWDHQPFFSPDPYVRTTTVGSIVMVTVYWVCTAGADQVVVQRFMATGSAAKARRSFLINSIAKAVVTITLGIAGFALLGYHQTADTTLTATDIKSTADQIFPHFIAHSMPAGLSGIVIAGLFSAVMSSLDSGINAVSAVVLIDFIQPMRKRKLVLSGNDEAELSTVRWLTVGIGIAIVGASTLVHHIPGNILAVGMKTTNLLLPPLFSMFFLALFVRHATSCGAVIGAVYGTVIGFLIAFWDLITGREAISFQWVGLASLVISILAGLCFSRLSVRRWGVKATYALAAALLLLITIISLTI